MKLTELEPEFVRRLDDGRWETVPMLAEADGLEFTCPGCGGHDMLVWFVGKVPNYALPGPGRWTPSGTGLEDLSLVPSINLARKLTAPTADREDCAWHGFITNGEVRNA